MQSISTETIAAIATPPGPGGISILRISGPDALAVLRRLFRPGARKTPGPGEGLASVGGSADPDFEFRPRHMHYGRVFDPAGELLDEVLAVYMPGPHSFTGEDVAEIHSHGGMGVSTAILEAAQAAGARIALPGEFSRRAFLNGRLDLAQAEAIAEMISAPGRQGVRLAAAKLEGALSRRIDDLRTSLDALRMEIILAVDFPDEDAELLSAEVFSRTAHVARSRIAALVQAYERARLWREGALAVLAGRVNTGKSSLLNALLGRDRAIVSPMPGTTRDYVEERLNVGGIALRLCDTAGLRQGGDLVEEEGIRRSRGLAEEADILLFVLQAGAVLSAEERDFLRKHENRMHSGRLLIVLNKIDLLDSGLAEGPDRSGQPDESSRSSGGPVPANLLAAMGISDLAGACPVYPVSAKQGFGLERLSAGMYTLLAGQGEGADQQALSDVPALDVAPNLRQADLLRKAEAELALFGQALDLGHPPDILAVHLDAVIGLLSEITGSPDNVELMNRIFSDFCIGK